MILFRMTLRSSSLWQCARQVAWLVPASLLGACSSSHIDFFEPGGKGGASPTGGTAGSATGGSDSGGTSGAITGGSGGTASPEGGSGASPAGGMGGDVGVQGGTGANGGMGALGGIGAVGGTGGPAGMGGLGAMAGGGSGGDAGTVAGNGGIGGTGGSAAGMGGAAGLGASSGAGGAGCTPTVPSTERCDGVDNNCTGGIDEGAACPDNCTGATREGHAYLFCSFEGANANNRDRSWLQASDFCTTRSLGLVQIDSAEEDAFVLAWVTHTGLAEPLWIGANDRDQGGGPGTLLREGTWVWGAPFTGLQFWQGNQNGMPVANRYNDWNPSEPNNTDNEDCGALAPDRDWHWADRSCSIAYPNFVCETLPVTTQSP